MRKLSALVAVLVLFVLHNNVFHETAFHETVFHEPGEPVFGWMPSDMVYRVVWVAVGALVLWWVLRVTWRDAR